MAILRLATLVLSLIFTWIAWGFWSLVALLGVALFLVWALKPKRSWKTNWGAYAGVFTTLAAGLFAVHAIWQEPAYTAAAVVIWVLAQFMS